MRRSRAAAFAILSVVLGAAWSFRDIHAQGAAPIRFALDHTTNRGMGGWGSLGGLAISPDGQQVAYISTDGEDFVSPGNQRSPQYIWLKSVAGGPASRLAVEDMPLGVFDLAFSPDGQSLAFGSPDGIRRVSIDGGKSTLICADKALGSGITWGADDQIVFSLSHRIMRVSPAGGTPSEIIAVRTETSVRNAEILPESGAVLFTHYPSNLVARPQVVVQRPGIAVPTVIANPGYAARYVAATQQIIYDREGRLYAVPFDPRELRITGPEITLAEDVTETSWGINGSFAVSSNGTLIYATGRHGWRDAAVVARDGTRTSMGRVLGTTAAVRVSPDGTQMAFDGEGHIWIAEIGHPASVRQLTTGKSDFGPVWTPDGQRIVFGRFAFVEDPEPESIYWQPANGRGAAELLIPHSLQPESWSGANRLSFVRSVGNQRSIWIYAHNQKTSSLFRYVTPLSSKPASAFSPNGKWLAYEDVAVDAARKEHSQVYVESVSKRGRRVAVPNAIGGRPVWSPDSRELFFDDGRAVFVAAVRDGGNGLIPTFADPVRLPITGFAQAGGQIGYDAAQRAYDLMPDGQHLLMMFSVPVELAVVPNWTTSPGGGR